MGRGMRNFLGPRWLFILVEVWVKVNELPGQNSRHHQRSGYHVICTFYLIAKIKFQQRTEASKGHALLSSPLPANVYLSWAAPKKQLMRAEWPWQEQTPIPPDSILARQLSCVLGRYSKP